jgi:spermidine synthase/Flp pilus assembly protein TadD
VQTLAGVFALSTVVLIWEWLPRVKDSEWLQGGGVGVVEHLGRGFLVAFAVMAVPTFLTGMTFPIVNRVWIRALGRLGRGVGRLYFANTIGSIAGSLAAGFIVLPLLGAKAALIATAGLSVALGLVCHLTRRNRAVLDPVVAVLLLCAIAIASPRLAASGRALLADTQTPEDIVLFEAEDQAAETRVYRRPDGVLQMSVDGHHIGGTERTIVRKEKVLAHLPMLLDPQARRTLSVGLGSGVTLGTLAMYDELETLVCVEIVPGVVQGARYFDDASRNVLDDPRLSLHVGDGVQYLLTTRDRFDIISSDSKLNPEYAGNAPLLSQDYYELCRDRLSDHGVMMQWLAVHLPTVELGIIARSFATAFPHVAVYWYDPAHILLAGSKSPLVFHMDAARRNLERPRIADDLKQLDLADPYVLAALFICDRDRLLSNLGDGPVNSWERPIIEFTMGRRFLERPHIEHEDNTLRWLRTLRDPAGLVLSGSYDTDVLARYLESAGALLDGFTVGGGVSWLQNGLTTFEAALERNPDDDRLEAVVTNLRTMREQIDKAATNKQMTTVQGLLQAGTLRRDQGRHQEALEYFTRAREQRPDNVDVNYTWLMALRDAGQEAQFETELREFIARFSSDPRGYLLLGRVHASAGRGEDAVASFRTATELDAQNPAAWNNLATALAGLERYQEAGNAFEKVCSIDPRYQKAAYFAAACFSKAAMPADAARWARFCIEEGIAPATQFATDPLFAGLRSSPHWDSATGTPR